jgi:hypothetical protein
MHALQEDRHYWRTRCCWPAPLQEREFTFVHTATTTTVTFQDPAAVSSTTNANFIANFQL